MTKNVVVADTLYRKRRLIVKQLMRRGVTLLEEFFEFGFGEDFNF
jgi:hypothetical protein